MGVWLRKSSHRFHGFAQMAWLRLFSHGIHRIHRSFVASVLPRNSRKLGCISSPTDFTDLHRWLVALILPQISRICTDGLVASVLPHKYILDFGDSVGTTGCHTLLICAHPCQSVGGISLPEGSVRSVGSVGGASLPEGSVCSVRSVGDIPACFVGAVLALAVGNVELRLLDSGGSVGMAGCHTLLICAHPCASVGGASLPEGSVRSVGSVGDIVSHGFHRSTQMVGCVNSPTEFTEFTEVWGAVGCVGTAGCHTFLHLCKSVLSVGATSQPEGSVRSVGSVGI